MPSQAFATDQDDERAPNQAVRADETHQVRRRAFRVTDLQPRDQIGETLRSWLAAVIATVRTLTHQITCESSNHGNSGRRRLRACTA